MGYIKPDRNGLLHSIGCCGGHSFFLPSNQDLAASLEVKGSWRHNHGYFLASSSVHPLASKERKAWLIWYANQKELFPVSLFSLIHVQAAFLRSIEELWDEFRL